MPNYCCHSDSDNILALSSWFIISTVNDLQLRQSFSPCRNKNRVAAAMEEEYDRKPCLEATVEEGQDGDVQVYYLSVPETEHSQVLDISNLLVQEGIQIVETQVTEENGQEVTAQTLSGSLVLNENGTLTDQTATQSAHALLKLSKSHGRSPPCGQIKVVDMLDSTVKSAEILDGETVELSSAPGTATYIVDENGTMIPLAQYRPNGETGYVQVEEAGVSTIAICTCWCGKEFITQEDLDRHKLIHDKPRTRGTAQLKCELCPEVFPSQSKLANHHRVIHPDGMPWECPVCFRRFSKKLGLKVHLRAHSGLKQHKCTFCDRSFSYKNALLRHLKLHTKDKPYKCSICGEGFTHLWAMRRHRATHKPASLYQCEICSKTFKQKQTLLIHARIHTGHKPYSCEICRKSFTLKSSLNQHIRIHTGERPKICPMCNKAFRQTSTLKSHMKLHTHLKPHKCRYCKTRFAAQEEMLEHERVHLKNKSWQCDECGMRFRNQSLLSRHVRKHTNERPFQCKICGKSFSQSGSLQSHMRTHTKEKPYQCRLCPKTYTTSGTLLIHIRRAHGLEAKKVKDVFPSTNYIEDQKIFTIRSHVPISRENITISSAPVGEDGEDSGIKTEVNSDSSILAKEGITLEEFVGGSEDIITQDGNVLIQRINLDEKGCDIESPDQPQDVEISQSGNNDDNHSEGDDKDDSSKKSVVVVADSEKKSDDDSSSNQGVGYSTVKELMTKRQIKPCSLTLMNIDGFSRYKVIDMENEKENSLYAQARQEAALGLAELSLVGGIVVSEKRAGTTSRTVAREVEDNRTEDPNVTKIILSKEGGVMNSQDPHQCPECKRIFGRKSIMVEHRRIHTDEKPYECDFCLVRFRQSAQLSSHIRNKHTKEKKYQCSFCQNHFLSRGITIRHINFHHKLKVRLCESIDPNWTVDEAIICKDKYELVVKDEPNIIEEGTVSVLAIQRAGDGSRGSDSNESQEAHKATSPLKNIKDTIPENSESGNANVEAVVVEDSSKRKVTIKVEKNVELDNQETETESVGEAIAQNNDEIVVKLETEDGLPISASDIVELTSSLSGQDEITISDSLPSVEIAKTDSIQDANFGESRLVCETCAMQFRGISSLRWHLRKVHQTTLAESDVSFVYEDEDPDEKAKGSANYPVQNEGEEHIEIAIEHSENQDGLKEFEGDVCAFPVHNKNSVAKSSLKCCICCVCFGTRVELEDHLKNHENDEVEAAGMHRCDTCGLVMKNTQQISKHILKMHGVENVYGCSICDKEFLQESSVLRHMKFFHKWEMKIRGEGNIPVLLKPAPASLHTPGSLESAKGKDKGRKENPSKRSRKVGLKVSSREENNVTFISLEVGDLEGLQLYREDGKKVKFEVVKSTNETTTIRIKDFQAEDSDEPEMEEASLSQNIQLEESLKLVDISHDMNVHTQSDELYIHSVDDIPPTMVVETPEASGAVKKQKTNTKSVVNDKSVTTLVVQEEELKNISRSSYGTLLPNVSISDSNTPSISDESPAVHKELTSNDDDKDATQTSQEAETITEESMETENPSTSGLSDISSEKPPVSGQEDNNMDSKVDLSPNNEDSSTSETPQGTPKVKTISVLDKSLVKDGINKATGALLKASEKQEEGRNKRSVVSSNSKLSKFETRIKANSMKSGNKNRKGVKSKQSQDEDASSSRPENKKEAVTPKNKLSHFSKTEAESPMQVERRSSSGRLIKRKRFSDEEP